MPNVSFTDLTSVPAEYSTELENINRRRRLQEALLSQSLQQPQTQMTGGRYSRAVPYSPLQGASKLIQAALLKRGMGETGEQLESLGERYRGSSGEEVRNLMAQSTGAAPWREPDPQGAIMAGAGSPYPEAQRVAAAMMETSAKPQKPVVVGKGGALVSQQGQELYRSPYTGPETDVNITMPGSDKFADEWAKLEVGNYGEHLKAAESAAVNKPAMQRFLASSDLASEGTIQPLFSFVKGVGTSFGLDFESLTAENIGNQANSEILSRFMRELGARGLTDQDMKILRESLPKMTQSKEARESVANIMLKSYDKQLETFSHRFNVMATKPEVSHMAYKPSWLTAWEKQKESDPLGIR